MATKKKAPVKKASRRTTAKTETPPTGPEAIESALVEGKKGQIKQKEIGEITVPDFREKVLKVRIFGDSLITHGWSDKARKQMLEIMTSTEPKKKKNREPKNPEREFNNARYIDKDGNDCIPAVAVKNALVTAGMRYYGYSQPLLRGTIYVLGATLPIKCKKMVMREDAVRVGPWSNRVADLRYRPEYLDWSIALEIKYDEEFIKPKSLINLLRRAGFSVGLHEWRIEKGGQHGGFSVDPNVKVVPFDRKAA